MAKTVREWNEEQRRVTDVARETYKREQEYCEVYVSKIAKKDIPVYDGRPLDKGDYAKVREGLRKKILQGGSGGFIGLVCDDCGTYLFDGHPMTLASSPPQFYADCCGCGRRYYLELSARVRRSMRDVI